MTVERIRQIERLNHTIGREPQNKPDQVAVEEPLEIRIANEALAVTMRTPGNDIELTVGLLLAEEIIGSADDLGTIAHCRDTDDPNLENIINVNLTPNCLARAKDTGAQEKMRRTFLSSSSCGICGKQSIESLHSSAPPFDEYLPIDPQSVLAFPKAMEKAQTVFDATGGIHAAAIFNDKAQMLVLREDIGRHNAVDKCIGALVLQEQLPLKNASLMVSGRTSFEIVQKALIARIQTIAAVSAPSSLAIDLALASKINLFGFVRDSSLNVYAGIPKP